MAIAVRPVGPGHAITDRSSRREVEPAQATKHVASGRESAAAVYRPWVTHVNPDPGTGSCYVDSGTVSGSAASSVFGSSGRGATPRTSL